NHTMFFTGAQWGCQGGTRVGGRWQQLTSRYTSLAGVVEAAIYEQEDSVAKHRGANSPMFRDVLLPDTRTGAQTLHIGKILRRHVLVEGRRSEPSSRVTSACSKPLSASCPRLSCHRNCMSAGALPWDSSIISSCRKSQQCLGLGLRSPLQDEESSTEQR